MDVTTTKCCELTTLSTDVPYILFVGTFEPRKGLDVLLDAFEEIAHATTPTSNCGWPVRPGWGVKAIEAQIVDATTRRDRIRRLGFVDDVGAARSPASAREPSPIRRAARDSDCRSSRRWPVARSWSRRATR